MYTPLGIFAGKVGMQLVRCSYLISLVDSEIIQLILHRIITYCTHAGGSALLIQAQPERVLILSCLRCATAYYGSRPCEAAGRKINDLLARWNAGIPFFSFDTMKVCNLLDNSHMFSFAVAGHSGL